jgi:hypothetical protein
MDASFRAQWMGTIGDAYRRLELVLLERAFNGTERVVTRRDGTEERMREYPNHVALKLLQMHRETAIEAENEPAAEDVAEIRERIVRKLQRMKKRDEATKAGSQRLRGGTPRESDPPGGERGGAAPGAR